MGRAWLDAARQHGQHQEPSAAPLLPVWYFKDVGTRRSRLEAAKLRLPTQPQHTARWQHCSTCITAGWPFDHNVALWLLVTGYANQPPHGRLAALQWAQERERPNTGDTDLQQCSAWQSSSFIHSCAAVCMGNRLCLGRVDMQRCSSRRPFGSVAMGTCQWLSLE